MKHIVTDIKAMKSDFNYRTDFDTKTGEFTITIFKEEQEQEITLSYWEAFLLSEKLNLEFARNNR